MDNDWVARGTLGDGKTEYGAQYPGKEGTRYVLQCERKFMPWASLGTCGAARGTSVGSGAYIRIDSGPGFRPGHFLE